jgi:hypothetical protein
MDKKVLRIKFSNIKFTFFLYYSGDLGNRWRYGHVTVQSNDPYNITFEGVVGTNDQV